MTTQVAHHNRPRMIGLQLSKGESGVVCMSEQVLHRTLRDITAQILAEMSPQDIEGQKPVDFTREHYLTIWHANGAQQHADFRQYEVFHPLYRATVVPSVDRHHGKTTVFAALGLYYTIAAEDVDSVHFYVQEKNEYPCELVLVDHAVNKKGDILLLADDSRDIVHPHHCGIIPRGSVGWPGILYHNDKGYDWLAWINWLLWERDENPLTALLRSRPHQSLAHQVVEILEAVRRVVISTCSPSSERDEVDYGEILNPLQALLGDALSPLRALTNERPRSLLTTAADQVVSHLRGLETLVDLERRRKLVAKD